MSLRTKVALPLAFFSALLIAYLYGYYIPRSRAYMETEYRQSVTRHLDSVAEGVTPLLLGRQLDAVYEYLDVLKKRNNDWLTIELIDTDGRTIYPLHAQGATLNSASEEKVFVVRRRIEYLNIDLGTIVLGVDFTPRLSDMRKRHQQLVRALLIILFAFMTTAVVIVEWLVRRPVNLLARASGRLAEGDFEVPLVKTGNDEVGVLVDSFARMRDAIRENQDALRKERDLVGRITATSPVGITFVDREGRITFANASAEKILGLSRGKIAETNYNSPDWHITDYQGNAFPDEELPFRRVMGSGLPVIDVRHAIEWPDGRRVLLLINAAPLVTEAGQVDGMVSVIQDVTERVKAEEALRQSEERYHVLFEGAPDAIFLADPATGKILDANMAAASLLGIFREELIGMHQSQLHPPRLTDYARETFDEHIRETMLLNESKPVENVVLRSDGVEVPVEVLAQTVMINNRLTLQGVFRDITERKHAEAELSRAQSVWGSAMDFIEDAIYLIDLDDKVVAANNAFYRMTGLQTGQVVGRNIAALMHPQGEPVPCPVCQARMARRDTLITMEAGHPDNFTGRPIEVMVKMISDPHDQVTGVLMGIRDLTSIMELRKQSETINLINEELQRSYEELEQRVIQRTSDLELKSGELQGSQQALMNIVEDLNSKTDELERANSKLRELDRLKSLFIASMSHELRTPLNSVIGFSSILLDEWLGPLTAEQKENLAIILRSGKHLLTLINDVIDVSKIEAGKVESIVEEFDLHDLVSEAMNLVQADACGKKLALTGDTIHHQLRTDRRRLLQSVINLLSNAVKFTEQGGITVQIRLLPGGTVLLTNGRRGGQSDTFIELAVEDTGMGIKGEDIQKLFQPFIRLVSPNQATIAGTGLGLYLTHKLVTEVLKGDILCTSTYGKGSTFTIRIPSRLP